MLVLCTGMIRSGSTWSYNVVRQLLARSATHVHATYSDSPTEVLQQHGLDADHVVVKCHDPDQAGRVLIKQRLCRTIYTYRDPLECLASGADVGMAFTPTLARLKASLELFEFQQAAGDVHVVWYDEIVGRPRDRVRAIADYLQLGASDEDVDGVAEMLSRENVRSAIRGKGKPAARQDGHGPLWDLGTLFNGQHVRDNPSDPASVVSATQRATIAKTLERWLDAKGRLRIEVRAAGMLGAPDLEPEPEVVATEAVDSPVAPDVVEPAQDAAAAADAAADPAAVDTASGDTPKSVETPVTAAPVPSAPAAKIVPPPLRPAAERQTEGAKLKPAAVAERQRLARELLRIIDSERTRSPPRRA